MGILRTECEVQYITPAGTPRTLPINCAKSNTESWPWKYLWIKTLGSTAPRIESNGIERADAYFNVEGYTTEGSSTGGQVVLRGVFAYIATDPINVLINCQLSMETSDSIWKPNYNIDALLEGPDGTTFQTFFDVQESNKTQTITLPATVCPKVLWVRARVQPAGGLPANLPACSGSLTVTLQ